MPAQQIVIEVADPEGLDAEIRELLAEGRTLVHGVEGVVSGDEYEVVLVKPADSDTLCLEARAVRVPECEEGIAGLELVDFSPDTRDRIERFLGVSEQPATEDEGSSPGARDKSPQNLHDRLRGLNVSEQVKVARDGDVNERTVLERLYGKAVWEALLRNPRLTHPEVARIARMGALPRPQLETIVSNRGWISSPQVRRALLTNRRLTGAMIDKVLTAAPKTELRLMPKQTAYPPGVREAARRMLRKLGQS